MRRNTCAASRELRAKLSVLPAREPDLAIVDLVLTSRQITQDSYMIQVPIAKTFRIYIVHICQLVLLTFVLPSLSI